MDEVSLSEVQAQVYEYLREHKRAVLGEIAKALKKDKAQIRRTLQVLVRKGLVKRVYHGLYELNHVQNHAQSK